MFLNMAKNRMARRANDESGYALLTVIGVLMVTIIIAALVSSMTVHALGYTSQTRASVQSQAAADAGISAGRVLLETEGACTTAVTSIQSTDPAYKVTVWRGTASGGWTPGCPLAATTQVRLISTGWSNDDGAVGQSGGDVSYEELVLASEINESSGSAIYVGAGGGFNGFKVTSGNGQTADIRVKNGDWTCTASGTYEGNIIVENGSANMENFCTVTGWIWASKNVIVKGGTQIGGDITASTGNIELYGSTTKIMGNAYAKGSLLINAGTIVGSAESLGQADLTGTDSIIGGSLWTKKLGTMGGKVGGNVISSDTAQTTTFPPSGKVTGNFTIGGPINTWITPCNGQWNEAGYVCGIKQQGNVGGTVLIRQSGLPSPTAKALPTVPGWYDFGYLWSDWQSAGYVQQWLDWPAGSCQVNNNASTPANVFLNKIANTTIPTVVDTRASGCSNITFSSSAAVRLKLKANITLIGNGFTLENMQVDSFDSNVRQFNLLVPDAKPTVAGKNCDSPSGPIEFNSTVKLSDKVYGMLYTPCNMAINNGSGWRGQIYTGSMTFSAADSLVYLPIGIPNANLDGDSVGSEKTAFAIASSRNRGDNGE